MKVPFRLVLDLLFFNSILCDYYLSRPLSLSYYHLTLLHFVSFPLTFLYSSLPYHPHYSVLHYLFHLSYPISLPTPYKSLLLPSPETMSSSSTTFYFSSSTTFYFSSSSVPSLYSLPITPPPLSSILLTLFVIPYYYFPNFLP